MQWMPTGVCFWLHCTVTGCSVRTSIKVGHYNPDLVVSAYNELGGNPWAEIRATLGLAQQAAATGLLGSLLPIPVDSAGNRTEGTAARDHQNLIYRETDAIGHPLSSLSGLVAGVGLLCPSETTSFVPYFESGLDALSWRQEVPEIFYPASFIPGLREIGSWPLHTWGGVYPRTGWTTQAEEPKAAAINAQRAGDIVRALDSRTSTSRTPLHHRPVCVSGRPARWLRRITAPRPGRCWHQHRSSPAPCSVPTISQASPAGAGAGSMPPAIMSGTCGGLTNAVDGEGRCFSKVATGWPICAS